MSIYLPAEWHKQKFVQMTWPHRKTDWTSVYDEAVECFCNIAKEIAKREHLIIVCQNANEAKNDLNKRNICTDNITFIPCKTNDTWARDHAFITCIEDDNAKAIIKDFQFNGWGLKFAANHDNLINQAIHKHIISIYNDTAEQTIGSSESKHVGHNSKCHYTNCLDFVFEGGSIESDGEGTLMVTSSCLLSKNHNSTLNQEDIENRLKQEFNADRVFWINHSWLAGDDTDGHIDTVARFCSTSSIAYVKCYDEHDEHFAELEAMENELKALRTKDGTPYTLYPLPLPDACCDDEGERLPATHANFLVINDAVLVPTYNQPKKDAEAIRQLALAFPDREIVGIDCRVLIIQHGSLHCSTMQYPAID